jgi:hypothetical protein
MIVIVNHVTPKDELVEDTKETVAKTTEGIEQDMKELLRCDPRMLFYASDDITAFLGQSMRI